MKPSQSSHICFVSNQIIIITLSNEKIFLDNKSLTSCYVMQRFELGASSKCFSYTYPISNKCKVNVFQFNTHAIALPRSSRLRKTYLLVFHFRKATLNSASRESIVHTASRPIPHQHSTRGF